LQKPAIKASQPFTDGETSVINLKAICHYSGIDVFCSYKAFLVQFKRFNNQITSKLKCVAYRPTALWHVFATFINLCKNKANQLVNVIGIYK